MGRHETVHTESDHYSRRIEGCFCWIYFALIQFWQNWQNDLSQEKLECVRIDKLLSLGMDTVACRRGVGCLPLISTISVHWVADALTLQTHWVTPRLIIRFPVTIQLFFLLFPNFFFWWTVWTDPEYPSWLQWCYKITRLHVGLVQLSLRSGLLRRNSPAQYRLFQIRHFLIEKRVVSRNNLCSSIAYCGCLKSCICKQIVYLRSLCDHG